MSKQLVLAASVLGAAIGLGVGYTVFALSWRGLYVGFIHWMTSWTVDVLIWAGMGVVLANAIIYIIKK